MEIYAQTHTHTGLNTLFFYFTFRSLFSTRLADFKKENLAFFTALSSTKHSITKLRPKSGESVTPSRFAFIFNLIFLIESARHACSNNRPTNRRLHRTLDDQTQTNTLKTTYTHTHTVPQKQKLIQTRCEALGRRNRKKSSDQKPSSRLMQFGFGLERFVHCVAGAPFFALNRLGF